MNADHIKPWARCQERRYDVDNGRTLCERCHKATHYFTLRRVLADEEAVDVVLSHWEGEKQFEIAKRFSISTSLVHRICTFQAYKHATCIVFGKEFPRNADEALASIRSCMGNDVL